MGISPILASIPGLVIFSREAITTTHALDSLDHWFNENYTSHSCDISIQNEKAGGNSNKNSIGIFRVYARL